MAPASDIADAYITDEKLDGQELGNNDARPTSIDTKPINSTPLRRFLTVAAVKVLQHFKRHRSRVIFPSRKICIKCGTLGHLAEASSMQFIAQHTSIPVPKVYCAFTRKGCTYLVMERIQGEILTRGWDKRPAELKKRLLSQLKGMVEEMRKIPAPQGQGVSNVDGGQIWDCRLPGGISHGPFKNIHEFHKYLRGGFESNPHPEVTKLISLQDRPWPPPVFTHGDLSSLNILTRGDDIVGIIDWETSGWYPTYWEYTTACQVNPYNEFWREEIDKFMEPLPKELEMEAIRQRYFGAF